MKKKILIGLVAVLVIIQFFRPERNLSDDRTHDVTTKYEVPANVADILQVACMDCHSNKTDYPWYAQVQPVGWWLNNHVNDGKGHLNFSKFTSASIAVQNHKFEEVVEMIEDDKMPLPSYTWLGLHSDANLSEEQQQVLIDWAKAQMAMLKENYPADSLVRRRRPQPQPQQ